MSKLLDILQVEDSESDALLMVRLLEKAGYDVHAKRVETASRMRAALREQVWDVIIADYHLPQLDAPSALALLHDTGLDIPFIVVSGAIGEDRAVAMMKTGAHDYLMKGNLLRLVPAVEREIQEATVRRERKLADEALRVALIETEQNHQLLDAVFAAHADAVLVSDTGSTVIRANPAAATIFGFDPTGMGVSAILESLGVVSVPARSATHRALAGETVLHLEQSAGDRTLESSASPMRSAGGKIIGAVTVVRDVTGRRLAEERMRQAQKLESIALLAGGIAHDFNNILTVVGGNVSLALDQACPDCDSSSILPVALEGVQRAAGLTRQLLAYAGKGAFVIEPVAVSIAGGQTIATLTRSFPERICVISDLAPNLPSLLMDRGQLEQVFSNLIMNAAEAIADEQPGTVTVRTALESDCIAIEVSDNGCGIDAETRQRMFDPFFSSKSTGRGLGLAAVEGIVRVMDGRILVESKVGEGTRIKVLLPIPKVVIPAHAPVAPRLPASAQYGAVLIVDDEPKVRELVSALLTKRGIPVLEASNGKEAIEKLSNEGAAVRAVLLDMAMPEMSGDVALPIIRKMRPDVHVIISSGYHDHDVQQHFSHIEKCGFLPKPYTREQLLAAILPVVSR
jgi:two-component system cell cycle sensor histidine kinase/response regulator CckA